MSEPNVLQLDIIANDTSGPGFASAKANASSYFSSVETEARRAAASLDALERRAALAGTGGLERINLQRSFSLSDLRLEHEQVINLTEAWDRLSTAKKHSVDIATLADITPRAPEGDISREEVLRRNLLAYDQFRQTQRQASIEHNQRDVESLQRSTAQLGATPTQRVALDRNQFFQTFSGTGAQRADAEAAFATRAKIALDQETEASGRAAGRATLRGEAEFAAALKAQQGVDTYTRSVERENEVYGKSGIEKIRIERERLLEQYKGHPAAIDAITTRYAQMEEAEKRATEVTRIERLKGGLLGAAVAAGTAAGLIKGFLYDTALYAARTETLGVVNQQLAISNDLDPRIVDKYVQLTKRKGITTQDALNTVNQLILTGLDVAQAPDLARGAQNQAQIASGIAGRPLSSSDVLSGIIHAIVERNVRELRTYGIQVSLQQAFKEWSQENPDKELTENQKNAVALNAVLAFMARSAGSYGAAMETVGKQISSLSRFSQEAKSAVGQAFLPALSEATTTATRLFTTIREHGEAFAGIAATVTTVISALAVFKTAAFAASAASAFFPALGTFAIPIAGVAAALTALAGLVFFTTDSFTAQRDAIKLHVDQLIADRDGLRQLGLTHTEYANARIQNDTALLAAEQKLDQVERERAERGIGDFPTPWLARLGRLVPQFATGGAISGPNDPAFKDIRNLFGPPGGSLVGPDGKTYNTDEYIRHFTTRLDQREGATRAAQADEEERAKRDVAAIQDRTRVSQGVLAAAKEARQLDQQYAGIQESEQQRILTARLDKSKGLAPESDLRELLRLAEAKVDREYENSIEDKRKRVDAKTGTIRDISGTAEFAEIVAAEKENRARRLRNEFETLGGQDRVRTEQYLKAQNDLTFGAAEKQRLERSKIEQELFTNSEKMDREHVDRKFTIETQSAEREKTLALDQLGFIDAQTIQQKLALEDQKLAIELRYNERSLDIQTRKLESERRREIDTRTGELNRAGIPNDSDARVEAIRQINEKYNLQEEDLRTATVDKEVDAAQKVANEKTKLGIQQNERIFDSLKRSAEGVFDALLSKSKSFSDVMKDLFKTAILTPIKDILSSQTAALFTELLTGQKVTFAPLGNGQGPLGELGNVLGRLGLGQRIIGNQAVHGINLPGHLGEVTHINGAVPVYAVNLAAGTSIGARAITPGILQAHALSTPFRGIPSLAEGGLDLANLLPQTPYEKVDSSVSYPSIYDTSSRSGPRSPQDPSLFSPHGFLALGQQLASASSDLSGIFAGGSNAYSDQYSSPTGSTYGAAKVINDLVTAIPSAPGYTGSSSGLLSRILSGGGGGTAGVGGLLSSLGLGPGGTSGFAGPVGGGGAAGSTGGPGGFLARLFGRGGTAGAFYKPFDIPLGSGAATTSAGIADSLGGGIFGQAVGGLAGFANSPGAGALGFTAALDGIRRGGILGSLEAAAGGAEVGFQYGGPIGAAVGAAVGGGIATIKSLFFESDRDHTKKLVRQIYGFSINDSTADAIIQIAKQKYGGAISIAVRTQEVRDLLKLYAETIGNKGAKDQFVADTVHSASLVESRGQLYQNAIYDNGEAYSYAGPLGVLGGISSTKLPTAARDSGGFYGNLSINLNGQSALGALAGQVVRVSTPRFIQSQSVSGSRASYGRNSQAALNFAPSAISR